MLELRGVSYRYPGAARPAIRDVDLAVAAGEVVGLAGANDAGKSTLCLVASGLAPASVGGDLTGDVLVAGESIRGRRPHELAGRTGIAFQDPTTQRSGVTGSVFEEVAFGPVNLGWAAAESIVAAREALRTLELEDLAERHPARLSGGEAQLVAIASILALRPTVLILDEPTAHLDPDATERVIGALQAITAAGTSLLIAEHRTNVLAALCGRVVVLEAGHVALDGPVAAVLADRRLNELGEPTRAVGASR